MNIEKLKSNGDYLLTDIVDNQLVQRRYSGYSLKEAKLLFKQFTLQLKLEKICTK